MFHAHRFVSVGREEGGIQCNIADIAACDIESRKFGRIEILGRRTFRENPAPNFSSLWDVWKWKLHNKTDPAQERRVERLLHIGRENRQTAVRFHTLEQVADFDVGIAVVAVLDFTAFTE